MSDQVLVAIAVASAALAGGQGAFQSPVAWPARLCPVPAGGLAGVALRVILPLGLARPRVVLSAALPFTVWLGGEALFQPRITDLIQLQQPACSQFLAAPPSVPTLHLIVSSSMPLEIQVPDEGGNHGGANKNRRCSVKYEFQVTKGRMF